MQHPCNQPKQSARARSGSRVQSCDILLIPFAAMSLEGLAQKFVAHPALRSKILSDGSLIAWPSVKVKGVCKNKDAQRLNIDLLKVVADLWCPQWDSPAMIPIDDVKDEVLGLLVLGNPA